MSKKNIKNPALIKGLVRAVKRKDLEVAKEFEIEKFKKEHLNRNQVNDSRIRTPNIRSELPKE